MGEIQTTECALPQLVRRHLEECIAKGALELPILPDVATQVAQLCQSEDADAAKISAVVHRDQALASHVLRVANSSLYAAPTPIVSLQQAISRLGLRALSDMVMSISVGSRVFRIPGYEQQVRRLWRHSVAAGFYAKEIARLRRRNVEAAFLCGLLHDIGKPIVLVTLLDLQKQHGVELSISVLEATMEEYHAQVGYSLAKHWKMPDDVAQAILHHHDFAAATEHAEAAMIACLADMLSYLTIVSSVGLDENFVREHEVLEGLNLYAEDIEALLGKKKQVTELTEVFLG